MPDVRPYKAGMLTALNEYAIGGRRERAHDYYIGFIQPFYRQNARKMMRGFIFDPSEPWAFPMIESTYETMSGINVDMTMDRIGFSLNNKNYRLELSCFGESLQKYEFAVLASYIDIPKDDCVFVGRYSHLKISNISEIVQYSYIVNMHRKNPVPFDMKCGLSKIAEELSLDLVFETYYKEIR